MKNIKLGLKIDSSYISLAFRKQKPDASGSMSLRLVEKPKHQDFEIFDNSTIDRIEQEVLKVEKESGSNVLGDPYFLQCSECRFEVFVSGKAVQ